MLTKTLYSFGGNNRLKLKFVTLGYVDYNEGLKLTTLNKNSGIIDSMMIGFKNILGTKKVNNPNFKNGIIPHINTNQ